MIAIVAFACSSCPNPTLHTSPQEVETHMKTCVYSDHARACQGCSYLIQTDTPGGLSSHPALAFREFRCGMVVPAGKPMRSNCPSWAKK